jgi:thioredoxin-related protein
MKKIIILYLLLFSGLFSLIQSQDITFEEALERAKDENKRIIVDVYTDWCGWCKKMDKDTYAKEKIQKIIDKSFVLVKLDAEGSYKIKFNGKSYSASELALHFQVTGYPTTVFLEPDGKVIEYKYDNYRMTNLPGYFSADDFRKILKYFRDGKYKTTDMSLVF